MGDGGSGEIMRTPPLAKRPIIHTWSPVLSYPIYMDQGTVEGNYYGITAKRMMGRSEGKGKFPFCQTKQSEASEIIKKKNGTTLFD